MSVKINHLFPIGKWTIMFTYLVGVSTLTADNPGDGEPIGQATQLTIAHQLLAKIEPGIRSTDFEGFINRLDLSNELASTAGKMWEEFKQQRQEQKQDAAETVRSVFVCKLIEADRDLVGKFGREATMRICRNYSKSYIQIIQKFAINRSKFLEQLRVQLNTDATTWFSAIIWLRRQRMLRGEKDSSWQDLVTLPDLKDQFERFLLEDEDFLPLREPTSKVTAEVTQAVQDIIEEWELKTDEYVDTYLTDMIRRQLDLRLARLHPDQYNWLTALRKLKVEGRRRYSQLWLTSENIASAIEPVVGAWAVVRWRRTTELVVFPESCPQNTFEQLFSTVVNKGVLSDEEEKIIRQQLLPLNKKLERIRSSFRKVTLWYEANLDPKYAGYDVPHLSIDIDNIETKYRKTIDAMIDLLADAMPSTDKSSLRVKINRSRELGHMDRYAPRSHMLAKLWFETE